MILLQAGDSSSRGATASPRDFHRVILSAREVSGISFSFFVGVKALRRLPEALRTGPEARRRAPEGLRRPPEVLRRGPEVLRTAPKDLRALSGGPPARSRGPPARSRGPLGSRRRSSGAIRRLRRRWENSFMGGVPAKQGTPGIFRNCQTCVSLLFWCLFVA